MTVTHYLVTDTVAEELERRTGIRGHNTPFGVLAEKPKPFDMYGALAVIDRALNPTRCTCGRNAIIHQPNCPAWLAIT